ncbi:MAG: selenocysteine-specific translation elongation factor [Dehalococcoidia bacterium]|nr:selenocysteine-specific translation elongation factor [Dehalococcoidia bacterium]
MFVIGTAGHIDHGKSLLIKALTGIDPDRLREERERGMTIDLGFAWMKLPGGQEVGIIDVPGHERFVKNMLAGVGGIDLALLIVAADEGVMPQTREHLAILDLLDITKGIVVITKKDLVDEELLSLVKLEAEELIKSTTLAGAPIVAVSAVTGEGLPELVLSIDRILSTAEPREDIGRPRLMVDRAFTISGSGTVVTGTLIDGSLSVGQEVEVVPVGLKARLRGLQSHKARIDVANPGSRVAANLTGVSTSQLERGYVLTSPGWLAPTVRIDVKLRMLSDLKHSLRHNAVVSFFTGAAEVIAKVHLLEREKLDSGGISWAQLALAEPVALVKGDRFIIRSPMDTLGGGVIVSSHAPRHRRFRPSVIQSLKIRAEGGVEDVVAAMLEANQPLGLEKLAVQCDLATDEAHVLVGELITKGRVVAVGQGGQRLLFTESGWGRLVKKAESVVENYHRRFPTRSGMSQGELGSKLGLLPNSPALRKLFADGVLTEEGAVVRLPYYQVQLSHQQQAKIDIFLSALDHNPYSPPGDITLEPDLLNLLIEQRQVVKVSDGVFFSASAYGEMVDKVIVYARSKGKVTLAEVRDMLGTSRKYAQALLEYMDEKKLTRRIGDERVLR